MSPSVSLPIDPRLPAIVDALREPGSALVLEATPGAGKTTRVPLAMMEVLRGKTLVLEPRRLAVRLAARHCAQLCGSALGEEIGYRVRHERRSGPRTRLEFMTEGLFWRGLLRAPTLPGVDLVILDEFHERHVDSDFALALIRALRAGPRPDLRLAVFSATLEGEALAGALGAQHERVEGRVHPLEFRYRVDDRPLGARVLRGLQEGLDARPSGAGPSALIFLPGKSEIDQATKACAGFARARGLELLPLHGSLSPQEQARAVDPEGPARAVLATNVAESSLTIPGVGLVVDSGLVRRSRFDPWSDRSRLELGPISQASAKQRAGRAARLGPGLCVRLYAKGQLERSPAFDAPDLHHADLSPLVLACAGLPKELRRALSWLEAPSQERWERAVELIRRLDGLAGSVPEAGLSELGQAMLGVPLTPRAARFWVQARREGLSDFGDACALLVSEGSQGVDSLGIAPKGETRCDLFPAAYALRSKRGSFAGGGRAAELSRGLAQLRRVELKSLRRIAGRGEGHEERETRARRALLAAFPDRVGRLKSQNQRDQRGGGRALALCSGETLTIREQSCLARPELNAHSDDNELPLAVAIDLHERREGSRRLRQISLAARIESDWLYEDFLDEFDEREETRFDSTSGRVIVERELRYEELVLESERVSARPSPETAARLMDAIDKLGLRAFLGEALEPLLVRVNRLRELKLRPELLGEGDALAFVRRALAEIAELHNSLSGIQKADPLHLCASSLSPDLERYAPATVRIPGRKAVPVRYESGRDPYIESRLQDFFGAQQGPSLPEPKGPGTPLVLHLLAPNRRAVQTTKDLAGFWERHYPELKKALSRRYPKHAWPEDPATASPPKPRGRRR